MNAITKVSEITWQDVAEYLRLPEVTESDQNLLNTLIEIAKAFITTYTGQSDLDKFEEFVDVVFILCQDMYDNRTMYVDKSNLNSVYEAILGMHSINLIPKEGGSE